MRACEIHCCLVSQQLLPNILPLMDTETRPTKVVMLVSPDMEQQFAVVSRICKNLGIAVSRLDVPAFDFEAIADAVLDLMSEAGTTVGLNVTGGTKIMALAAYEACREDAVEIFYIDTQNDRRITLKPGPASTPLRDVLGVRSYLDAYDYQIADKAPENVPREHRTLTEELVRRASYFAKVFPTLNYYALAAEDVLYVEIDQGHLNWKQLRELLELFREAAFLDIDSKGRLVFPGEAERLFVNGGWLERHVLSVCNKLRHDGRIHDIKANILVRSENGVENEIDLAFTARNRLFLVECKTRRYKDKQEAAANAINKLSALRPLLSGVYGRAIFVSLLELGPTERQRCAKFGIELVQAGEINNLHARILNCIVNA
jgi:hypothetical protein